MTRAIAHTIRFAAAAAAVSTVLAGQASAGVVTLDAITAAWIDPAPATGISSSGAGTDSPSLRWGTSTGYGKSGYDFEAAATPIDLVLPPTPSPTFTLGEFTHLNYPITGTSLSEVTLQVSTDISIDGMSQGVKDFFFDFTHFETPNADNPCANGAPNGSGVNAWGCADLVTIGFNDLSETIMVGDSAYTLTVQGFMTDDGFVEGFQTKEKMKNKAQIIAQLSLDTRSTPVSEPAGLALFGLGAVGFFIARRRRDMANAG